MRKEKYDKQKVDHLYKLAQQYSIVEQNKDALSEFNDDINNWNAIVSETTTSDLIALTSILSSKEESPSRRIKALRESVISQVAYNNACQITETMERLDKTAAKLTIVSVFLSVLGIIIAILQFVR